MKLIFSKTDTNEINVKLQKGTIVDDFTYVEMIRQLLVDKKFEDCDFGNLSDIEKDKINAILRKVEEVFNNDELVA